MAQFQSRTTTEQLVEYLRGELIQRRWTGELPGSVWLARELGVGKSTTEAALAQLEAQGLLVPQGPRRRRRIDLSGANEATPLKVQVLLYEDSDRKLDFLIEMVFKLQQAGHVADFSDRTLLNLGMDRKRVAKYVSQTDADVWMVVGGNREILEWFAGRAQPAYALFGRQPAVAIGGVATARSPALVRALEGLIGFGHQRIVMLSRTERRKPDPGMAERSFVETLSAHGIPTGPFNLPDWEDDAVGFRDCLDGLFAVTPPTALILDQPHLYFAAQQHLSGRGLVAPRDVSMLCNDADPIFQWSSPEVSHIRWDSRRLVRIAVRWVGQVARGQVTRRQHQVEATWVQGGTVGPLPSRG